MRSLLLILLMLSVSAFGKDDHTISKSQVLNLISEYKQAPISETGFSAVRKILNFAETSKDVLVEVSPENTPWLTHQNVSDSIKGLLLGAYVVGNIEPQLIMSKKKSNHCSGAIEVARVIKLIVLPDAAAEIKLVELLNNNSMKQHQCSDLPLGRTLNNAE